MCETNHAAASNRFPAVRYSSKYCTVVVGISSFVLSYMYLYPRQDKGEAVFWGCCAPNAPSRPKSVTRA